MRRWTVRLVALNAAGLIAAAYGLGFLWLDTGRSAAPMLVVAHRGDVANEPENTIAAVLSAAEQGADGIEVDIQRSASGTWWVMHDLTVDRTTDGQGSVRRMADAELESLTITGGAGYHEGRHAGQHQVPRLDDVLDALDLYRGRLYLHVRTDDAADFGRMAELVTSRGITDRTAIIGNTDTELAAVKAVDPSIRTLLLHDAVGFPTDSGPIDAWLTSRHRIVRADIVAWRPYDVEVFVDSRLAGTDESSSLQRAHGWNVAAYFTNDLATAQETIRRIMGDDT